MQEGIEGCGLGSNFSLVLHLLIEVSFMPNLKRTTQDQTVDIFPSIKNAIRAAAIMPAVSSQ